MPDVSEGCVATSGARPAEYNVWGETASAVAPAYSGDLGAMPPVGSRAKPPGESRGQSSLKLKAILLSGFDDLTFWCSQIFRLFLNTC